MNPMRLAVRVAALSFAFLSPSALAQMVARVEMQAFASAKRGKRCGSSW